MMTTDAEDELKGLEVLKSYYNHATRNFPTKWQFVTFNDFLKIVKAKQKWIVKALGMGVHVTDMSVLDFTRSMQRLSFQLKGEIPDDIQIYNRSLNNQLQNKSIEFWLDVSTQSAKDLLLGLQEIGDETISAITGFKGMGKYVKYGVIGGGGLYIYLRFFAKWSRQ
jgi:hypothetical protein